MTHVYLSRLGKLPLPNERYHRWEYKSEVFDMLGILERSVGNSEKDMIMLLLYHDLKLTPGE